MRRFRQVDVFTRTPFLGNPVAVVLDADDLDPQQMQAIARWTNLSETTFVVAPTSGDADYRLRIFTPAAELPFAGHPTLGSAHAAIEAGVVAVRDGRVRQECGAGVLTLQVDPGGEPVLWLRAPRATVRGVDAAHHDALRAALGTGFESRTPPLCVDVGPVWLVVRLDSAQSVDALRPDLAAIARLSDRVGATGIVAFGAAAEGEAAMHVRAFAPGHGVPEDPVCGSGNVSVAAFIHATGLTGSIGRAYRARQGMQLGRDGQVWLRIVDGGAIDLGGNAVTCVDGTLLA